MQVITKKIFFCCAILILGGAGKIYPLYLYKTCLPDLFGSYDYRLDKYMQNLYWTKITLTAYSKALIWTSEGENIIESVKLSIHTV